MNGFSNIIIEALGWTLVHSLWQASLVLLLLAVLLLLFRRKSAVLKYFLSFMALAAILVWALFTFANSYRYATEKQSIKDQWLQHDGYLKSLLVSPSAENGAEQSSNNFIFNIDQIQLRAFFQRNFKLICLIWFFGIGLLALRMLTGLLYTHRLRTHHLVPLPVEWQNRLYELSIRMGIRRKIEGFFSPLAKVPMTLGTLKPLILFPVTAFTGLSTKEVEAIIAHELAHILRNDYLFNMVQSLIGILFFYHPAVWAISSRIRAERENCCDNLAVEAIGDKQCYIKTLALLQIRQAEGMQLSMAFSMGKGSVIQRIKRLQNEIAMKTNFIEGLVAVVIILAGLTLASFTTQGRTGNFNRLPEADSLQTVVAGGAKPINRDSLKAVIDEKIKNEQAAEVKTEELQKAMEVALSETNEELSAEMMAEIDEALNEINVEKIVREAMCVAAEAMKEASVEVDRARMEVGREDINRDMREAAREIAEARREMERDMRRDMARDGIDPATIDAAVKAATAGLDIAASVVGSLDVEGIVTSALSGVSAALEAVGNAGCDSVPYETSELHGDPDKERIKQIEREKKQLEKQQKQLEKQLHELEKQIEKLGE